MAREIPLVRELDCHACEVGRASGAGHGQMCPFIDRQRPAGTRLYAEGDPATYVWFVKAGTVVLSRGDGDGRARAVRSAGAFVGLEALVTDCYVDSAQASTDVVLCGATRDGMDAWLGAPGTPARTALELTLRASCADPVRRAGPDGNATARVAQWLCEADPRSSTAALPRKQLADLLGMRPETLSRALASLVERGAIATTRRSVSILDAELLARLAGRRVG